MDAMHVVVGRREGWDVRRPGAGARVGHAATQQDAVEVARRLLADAGGEVRVHGRDGVIKDTVHVQAKAPASLGADLEAIGRDLDATTSAWAAAGHPLSGPVTDAREAVFDRLHRWNKRAGALEAGHTCQVCSEG